MPAGREPARDTARDRHRDRDQEANRSAPPHVTVQDEPGSESHLEYRVRYEQRNAKRVVTHTYGIYREPQEAERAAQRVGTKDAVTRVWIVTARVSTEVLAAREVMRIA